MGRFIDFALVKDQVPFAKAIELLDLKMKFAGNQWRGQCPACGGSDRGLVITQDVAFHCKVSDVGGDQIALAKHTLDLTSMRDAAFELAERAGIHTGTSTVSTSTSQRTVPESERDKASRSPRGGAAKAPPPQPSRQPFDADEFWAKTAYTDEVADLGITEEEAEALRIGFYRGKLYQALRHANGEVAGYSSFANGELKLPSTLLPMTNVVKLRRA